MSATTNQRATIQELLEEVFSVWSAARLYASDSVVSLSEKWHFVFGGEDSALLAAKNCTAESWRKFSCRKRHHGECFVLVSARKNIFVFIP
jgi:hypothetical protein